MSHTFEAVKTGSEKAKSLVQILLVLVVLVSTAELDAAAEEVSDVLGRGHDASTLVRNVVLHTGLLIDAKLNALINGATKSAIVLAGILVIGVVLRVVNVVFGAVAAKPISSDLELLGAVAESKEAKDTEEQTDRFGRDRLDRAYINSLGVVAKPVSEVNTRDIELVKLLATSSAGHDNGEEDVFKIAMTP